MRYGFGLKGAIRHTLTTSKGDVSSAPAIPPILFHSASLPADKAVSTHPPAAECFHPCSFRFSAGVCDGEAVDGGKEDVGDGAGSRNDIEAAEPNDGEVDGPASADDAPPNQELFELDASVRLEEADISLSVSMSMLM